MEAHSCGRNLVEKTRDEQQTTMEGARQMDDEASFRKINRRKCFVVKSCSRDDDRRVDDSSDSKVFF